MQGSRWRKKTEFLQLKKEIKGDKKEERKNGKKPEENINEGKKIEK